MKKILLTLLFVPILFSSCLDINNGGERSPVQGGIDIYNMTNPSNFAALEPVTVSMKLNALLTHRDYLGSNIPLDQIIYDDKNMSDMLFGEGEASFTDYGGGSWEIKFKGLHAAAADYARTGSIRVITGNKLLQDLPGSNNVWIVENVFEDSNEQPYMIVTQSGIAIRISILSTNPSNAYVIAGADEANTWNIECPKVMSYMINRTCLNVPYWGISYQLKLTGSNLSFEGLSTSTFAMEGSAGGNVPNYASRDDLLITYEIESALKSGAACKLANNWKGPYQNGGAVRITVDEASYSNFDKILFPSNTTKWTWASGADQCSSLVRITYNGVTTSSSGE